MSAKETFQENAPKSLLAKIRLATLPVFGKEFARFVPMSIMIFFILFNYTAMRDTKDALIATSCGAEAFSYLKLGVVTPASIIFVIIFTKLSNIFSREKIFYLITSIFIVFFGSFAYLIYPAKDIIHPDSSTIAHLSENFWALRYVFKIFGSWTYGVFYAMAELWGTVMISLLFWQFANEITRPEEAKRFYAMFYFFGNFSLFLSGLLVRYFSQIRKELPPGIDDPWQYSLNYLMGTIVIAGIIVLITYWVMNRMILPNKKYYTPIKVKDEKKSKPKLSVTESFKYILSSPYIGYIAILVIGYGLSINLIEIVWKNRVAAYYSNPNDYASFMGGFSAATGFVTIVIIFLTKGIVRRFGWYIGAIITPITLLVTGSIFFVLIFFQNIIDTLTVILGLSSLYIAVMLGAAQNFLTKGAKYAIFDPTKEMSYIPLDAELKSKGKAAVDVIGGRLGKAGGSLIQILTWLVLPNALVAAPYFAGLVLLMLLTWVWAIKKLNVSYHAALDKRKAEFE